MLRRSKTISLPDDDELPSGSTASATVEPVLPQRPSVSDEPLVLDRRQGGDRRGSQDNLRTEFQRSLELAEQHGLLDAPARIRGLSGGAKLRIALVVLAVLAGGAAAWLATHGSEPAPVTTVAIQAPPPAPVVHVLVASRAIGLGERLTSSALSWQEWPDKAARPDYITDTASPDAMTKMAGDVARAEFVAGEPILASKLVSSPDGFLSAVLSPGMRGVSVNVTPDAASGGFIVPNDHVDVVLTRASQDNGAQVSQTLLTNVRVLAINTRLGDSGATGAAPAATADPGSQVFAGQAVATLELDPVQSQVIVNAIAAGKLTLVLRPLTDAKPTKDATEEAADEAIRMSSPFWTAHPTTAITAPNLSTGPYTATTANSTPR